MTDNFSGNFDLFGEPIPARKGKRGRPAHVWTQENSNKINLLFAVGYSIPQAAVALGISEPTFRKHYFHEVEWHDQARMRLKAKLMNSLMTQAEGGSVAAMKELRAIMEKSEMEETADRRANIARSDGAGAARPLGKKEAALEIAMNASGIFAPPAAPDILN